MKEMIKKNKAGLYSFGEQNKTLNGLGLDSIAYKNWQRDIRVNLEHIIMNNIRGNFERKVARNFERAMKKLKN